jgi:hypothetical protein
MANARRQEDVVVDRNWLTNIGRFELRDIAILLALILWMSSLQFGGANDSTARAATVEVKQAAAVHQAQADGRWGLILQRLDDLKTQNEELRQSIIALNEKLDRQKEK